MAKLQEQEITKQDIVEYLDSIADFSFELEVLNMMSESGCECTHGGTYEDPVTSKSREYDIRGIVSRGPFEIRLAVECKNLRDYFPLVVLCVPRKENESFHEVCFGHIKAPPSDRVYIPAFDTGPTVNSVRLTESRLYPRTEQVGKSCNQVGRNQHDRQLTSNDSELYEKWSQAISSAYDLLTGVYSALESSANKLCLSMILPILVVPNNRLWIVEFGQNGARQGQPTLTERCSYFAGKSYDARYGITGHNYTISHLEIMTFAGLNGFLHRLKNDEKMWETLFPLDEIQNSLKAKS